jgi:hypothetical protein
MVVAWALPGLDIGVAYLNFENTLISISGCRRYYGTSREGKGIKKVATLVLLWGRYRALISHFGRDVSKEVRTPLIMRPVMR